MTPDCCQQISGYTMTPDMDHNGDDIGQSLDVLDKCNADSTCKGFNSAGWYKRVVSPTSTFTGTCFYTKIGTSKDSDAEMH
ncbi:hypothetical protein TSOC_014572 [Tetrabaena socialis]|uniref:Apple domain-containing protein n=1 Tax=Tetrabaena socialis TaxID=47790 RepID=A0A2J7ZHA5_9CHLO|nr:hypothetical protein TSOC_014572 [Tetrabaena socialis]|eukprot:PNG99646.1 hypothetical protein TSOC_014572 [Tetrabaena socialis]